MFGKRHSVADILEGVIIGGSIAAVTTFIFGTKKGKQVQKYLAAQAERLRKKASRTTKRQLKRKVRRVRRKVARKVAGTRIARRSARRTARR